MGIDAEMFVKLGRKITSEEVLEAARSLAEAIGPDHFFLAKPGLYGTNHPGHHALSLEKEIHQDSSEEPTIKPKRGESFIRVHLWTRYYSPGYERGNWPIIASVAEWLQRRFPDGEVWYGGDSSGVEFQQMTPSYLNEVWTHFASYGHSPYQQSFDNGMLDRDGQKRPPPCELCKTHLIRNGWGPSYGAYFCGSCGLSLVTRDNGKTFTDRKALAQKGKAELYKIVQAIASGETVSQDRAKEAIRNANEEL